VPFLAKCAFLLFSSLDDFSKRMFTK
jgi:hypothetical protein